MASIPKDTTKVLKDLEAFEPAPVSHIDTQKWVELIKSLGYKSEHIDMIRTKCMPASTPLEEAYAFLNRAKKAKLDPLLGQIYLTKNWSDDQNRYAYSIVVGINGHRLIASRTERYAPGKETEYRYDPNGKLLSSTCYVNVYHEKSGTWTEVAGVAHFDEYAVYRYDKESKSLVLTPRWEKMGHTMLEKCAEMKALRRAFPDEMAGFYSEEEIDQMNSATSKPIEAARIAENLTTRIERKLEQ
jgi:phage recombination protein Bet